MTANENIRAAVHAFVAVAAGEMSRANSHEDNLEILFDHIRTQVAKAGVQS